MPNLLAKFTILFIVIAMLSAAFPISAADYSGGNCGCVGLANPAAAPCSEIPPDREGLSGNPASLFLALFWWWRLFQAVNEITDFKEQEAPLAEVAIEIAPTALVSGQSITATAVATNYRTRYDNMYFGWCVTDKQGKSISYNSVVAGGELAELSDRSTAAGAGGCCGWLTRTPEEDVDNDGMDDNWEREKFVGRTINGVTYTSIEQVLPGDDPDSDGYLANRFFLWQAGDFVTLTPGLVDSLGNTYIPGSDDRFPNIMEYIIGTDPLNGDTDGDGYNDGMDFIGVGQMRLDFTVDKFVGLADYLDIGVSVVGVDQNKMVYITSSSRRIFATPATSFRLTIDADQDVLPVGAGSEETVTVEAVVEQGEVTPNTLEYEWYLQGENICDTDAFPELGKFCGAGKNTLVLGGDGPLAFTSLPGLADLEIGDEYSVKATAVDSVTRQSATAELKLLRAATLELSTDCAGENSGVNEIAAGGEESLTICVGSYGIDVNNTEKITYQWYKDGNFEQAQSGVGKDTYELRASKPAGANHRVSVTAKAGYSQAATMSGDIDINIIGPTVRIIEPASRLKSSDNIAEEASRMIEVNPGETIDFSAAVSGFGEQANYNWQWTVSGQKPVSFDDMSESSSFSFTVPENAGLGAKYSLAVAVRGENNGEFTDAADGIWLVVAPTDSQTGSAQKFFKGMAAAFSWLPPQTRLVVQIALLVLIALVAVGGVGYFYHSFLNKNNE